MPYLIIRHRVQDYAAWKPVFDAHGPTRQANGSRGGYLFRSADDPNDLVMLLEWDDLEKARQFTQLPDLRQKMQDAGVVGQPDFLFLDEIERPPM